MLAMAPCSGYDMNRNLHTHMVYVVTKATPVHDILQCYVMNRTHLHNGGVLDNENRLVEGVHH